MRIGPLAALAAVSACAAMSQTQTQTLAFPAGGTVHVRNSAGELAVEGWDRTEVELTAIHSGRGAPLTIKQNGTEILVDAAKRHNWAESDQDYRIRMPRSAKLVVEHGTGEVHVAGLTGDIHARVCRGEIALSLPAEGKYAIDASSVVGDIVSDYPGKAHRRPWIFAHRFEQEGGTELTHQLYLRVGFGDILILKTIHPAAPGPLAE
jgi:hypothetical protein